MFYANDTGYIFWHGFCEWRSRPHHLVTFWICGMFLLRFTRSLFPSLIAASLLSYPTRTEILRWMQVSNLVFAAAETHRWYLQKFDNYPSNRCSFLTGFFYYFINLNTRDNKFLINHVTFLANFLINFIKSFLAIAIFNHILVEKNHFQKFYQLQLY